MNSYPNASSELAQAGVSFVIPNYNHGHYLPDTIHNRLRQSHAAVEVIVVDDASTDDSVAIVERECAQDPRVRLIRRTYNGGPNVAITEGLKHARGRFVAFSAADDTIEPQFAEQAVTALQRFPQAALCFMEPCMLFVESGQKQTVPLALASHPTYFAPDRFERLMRKNFFTIPANTVVYRRDKVAAIGGFRADLEWQADWLANLVLTFRHGACYVPQPLAQLRVSEGTYSWEGTRHSAGQRRLLYRCLDVLAKDYPDVAPRFRSAALVPEMRLRDMLWLVASPSHRGHLTPRLGARLLAREAWTVLRPVLPLRFRQWWRRRAATIRAEAKTHASTRAA